MPTWNAAAFIGPVLASIAAQTYPNLELLISVDICSDGTAEACDAFAATHANVRVIKQPTRLGWIANTNALLAAAAGDYVFFAFHDDPLAPEYVATLVAALEEAPRAVLAFSDMATNRGLTRYDVLDGVADRFERARRLLRQQGPWWTPHRGLMRAKTVRSLGGLQRHRAGEVYADLPWLLRLALCGEFVRVPEPLITKTYRAEGLSERWRGTPSVRLAVQCACLRAIREAGFPLGERLRLYAEAWLFTLRLESWYLRRWLAARLSFTAARRRLKNIPRWRRGTYRGPK